MVRIPVYYNYLHKVVVRKLKQQAYFQFFSVTVIKCIKQRKKLVVTINFATTYNSISILGITKIAKEYSLLYWTEKTLIMLLVEDLSNQQNYWKQMTGMLQNRFHTILPTT